MRGNGREAKEIKKKGSRQPRAKKRRGVATASGRETTGPSAANANEAGEQGGRLNYNSSRCRPSAAHVGGGTPRLAADAAR